LHRLGRTVSRPARATGRVAGLALDERPASLFLLFSSRFSAIDISYSAEILYFGICQARESSAGLG
jgi:hypothetical protein